MERNKASGSPAETTRPKVKKSMKAAFPGFYPPTEVEFQVLWQSAEFVFDASALLNPYGFSAETRTAFFGMLSRIKLRLWLPHQFGLEYNRNRRRAIAAQQEVYRVLENALQTAERLLKEKEEHPSLDKTAFSKIVDDLGRELDSQRKKHASSFVTVDKDILRDEYESLFEDRIGDPLSLEAILELEPAFEYRMRNRIPPGFKDFDGSQGATPARVGDFLAWQQILSHAKSVGKPVILVTDDEKADWWEKDGNKTIGPHPLLVQEMAEVAGVRYYSYTLDRFLHYSKRHLDVKLEDAVINEAKVQRESATAVSGPSSRVPLEGIVHLMPAGVLGGPINPAMIGGTLSPGLVGGSLRDYAVGTSGILILGGRCARCGAQMRESLDGSMRLCSRTLCGWVEGTPVDRR